MSIPHQLALLEQKSLPLKLLQLQRTSKNLTCSHMEKPYLLHQPLMELNNFQILQEITLLKNKQPLSFRA